MGGGVLFFVAILQYFPLKVTIPLHGFVQMWANISRVFALRKALRRSICIYFVMGSLVGVFVVLKVMTFFSSEVIPFTIILALILYSVFKPKKLPDLRIPNWGFGPLGFVTGFLAILIGAVDPILAPFFIREDFTPQEVVANKSIMQAVIHLSKIPVFLHLGFAYTPHIGLLVILVLGSFVGTYLGVYFLHRIPRKAFVIVFKTILFLIGCNIAVKLFRLLSIGQTP